MATFVCSDIHGQFDTWLKALSKSEINLDKGDKLVILGDLIDRGEDSFKCVDYALDLIEKYPSQVTYLMGNHEKFLLDFVNVKNPKSNEGYIELQINGQTWMANGGYFTVKSFLGEIPESLFDTYHFLNDRHSKLFQKLNDLPYYKVDFELNCVYVHAGFKPNVSLADQDIDDMIWIREEFFKSFQSVEGDILDEKLIVHGHTPVQYMPDYNGEGYYKGKHNICVDGGSAMQSNILIVKMDDLSYISVPITKDRKVSV